LTALSAFRVLDTGDRVGAVIYNDESLKFFKPQRSKQGAVHILSEVVKQNQKLHSTNTSNKNDQFNEALKIVSAAAKHDDLIILIGDGRAMDEKSTRYVTTLSAHNDVLAALVYDPMEKTLHSSSSLFLSDGNVSVDVDSSSQAFQKRFSKRQEERAEGLMHLSKKHTIPLFSISTDRPVLVQVQEQLGATVSARRRF
jgi:uncharacterized protein (DUF58 family)